MSLAHYAFKVNDIESTQRFYVEGLGCSEGRSTDTWLDFDFFGHQLSAHISPTLPELDYCGQVDGDQVPIPHFGCVLTVAEFQEVQRRLVSGGFSFVIPPTLRYPGKTGEQWTMFVLDLSGNPIEFKAFTNPDDLFAS